MEWETLDSWRARIQEHPPAEPDVGNDALVQRSSSTQSGDLAGSNAAPAGGTSLPEEEDAESSLQVRMASFEEVDSLVVGMLLGMLQSSVRVESSSTSVSWPVVRCCVLLFPARCISSLKGKRVGRRANDTKLRRESLANRRTTVCPPRHEFKINAIGY